MSDIGWAVKALKNGEKASHFGMIDARLLAEDWELA